MKNWKVTLLGFFIILALTLILRLYNLDSLPIFADEAIYIRWAQVMRAEPTLRFLPLSDGKQPLFMWSIIPSFKLFSDPLVAGRVVSVVTGMGTLVGIFVLSVLLFAPKKLRLLKDLKLLRKETQTINIGLMAALFYAISSFSVFFDRMALADSMLAMLCLWFIIFYYLTVVTLRLDLAMIAGFFLGAAFITKSPALFIALIAPILWLFVDWKKERLKIQLVILSFLSLVTYFLSLAIYNILRLGPNFHLLKSRTGDYVHPLSHVFSSPLDPFRSYIDRSFEYLLILGPWMLVVLGILGILFTSKNYLRQKVLLLALFIIPILVVSEFSKTMTARYIYFTLPYFYILAASAFLTSKRLVFNISRLLMVTFVLIGGYRSLQLISNPADAALPRSERSGYLEEWTAGTGIKEASDIIREYNLQNPNNKVVVGTEGYFGTLPDGLQVYLNDLPEVTVIGVGTDFTKIPSSLIESRDFGNKTYLLVNSSRFKHNEDEFDELGLIIVEKWQKADRPEGIRERVQHGKYDLLYLLELN